MDGRVPVYVRSGAGGHDRAMQRPAIACGRSGAGDRDGLLGAADGEDDALSLQPGEKGLDSVVTGTGDWGLGTGPRERGTRNEGPSSQLAAVESPVPSPQSP